MRIRLLGIAASALLSSASANAGLTGYCYAIVHSDYYFTPVIELPENTEYVSVHLLFERFFEDRVGRTPRTAQCDGFQTREEAEQTRSSFLQNLAGRATSTTFLSGFPPDPRQTSRKTSRSEPTSKASDSSSPASAQPRAQEQSDRAAEHAAVEARNREKQALYEAQLAEQKRLVDELARKKEAQRVAAGQALADHDAQLAAHAATLRQHGADVAKYEQEVAAQELRKNFDERNKLGREREMAAQQARKNSDERQKPGQASIETDANRCITTPETQINASFQGNTAASVINGCGQPVDVRICLMSDSGWKCGATYGLASQQRWSFSAFKATGEVFADARTSGSSRPLARPN